MTGIEARDFVLNEINSQDPEGKGTSMNLSYVLALDLLKLSPNEIGSFADITFKEGIAAFKKHGLYGYTVDIDHSQRRPWLQIGQ